jgi:tetratricopeptide (TPR) repeat protein
MTSFHRVRRANSAPVPAAVGKTNTQRASRFSWRLIVPVLGVALLIDFGATALLRGHKPLQPSVVLPNVPQLQELRLLAAEDSKSPELHLTLAQSYLHYKYYLSARDEFDQALKLGADEWAVRTGRAEAALAVQRSDAAAQDMERMLQMRPTRLETYLALAETQQHADDWPAAQKTLDRVPLGADHLPVTEGDPLANAELLATAYSHIDAWDKAMALIGGCLKVAPERQSSHIMLGKALHATGKPAEAIPYLLEGIKLAPQNAELQYLLGTAYQARKQTGDDNRALACFQAALSADNKHGAAMLAMARELDRRGMKKAAAAGYLRADKLGMEGHKPLLRSADLLLQAGEKEEGHYRRGLYFEAMGRPSLAVPEYFQLNKMHSYCRSSYIHIARAYAAMHQPTKTLAYLKMAQQHDPPRANELDWSIIQAYGDLRNESVRLDALRAMVARNDKASNEARYQLATSADAAGKTDEGAQWLRECILHEPNDGVFHADLGKVLLQQRNDPVKLKEATEHLETAIHLAPDNYEGFYYLGLAYSYVDRKEDAILALRHAVDLQPEDGEGYQTLAMTLNRTGKKAEATDALGVFRSFEDFQKARETLAARCKRRPGDPQNQLRMAEFHMRAHEYSAAIERYSKCLALQPENRAARVRLAEACGYMGHREDQRVQLAMLRQHPGGTP